MTDSIDHELRSIVKSITEGGPEPESVTAFRAVADARDHWIAGQVSALLTRVVLRAAAPPAPDAPAETRRLQVLGLLRDETANLALVSKRLRARAAGSAQLADRIDVLTRVLPTLEAGLVERLLEILDITFPGDQR